MNTLATITNDPNQTMRMIELAFWFIRQMLGPIARGSRVLSARSYSISRHMAHVVFLQTQGQSREQKETGACEQAHPGRKLNLGVSNSS